MFETATKSEETTPVLGISNFPVPYLEPRYGNKGAVEGCAWKLPMMVKGDNDTKEDTLFRARYRRLFYGHSANGCGG